MILRVCGGSFFLLIAISAFMCAVRQCRVVSVNKFSIGLENYWQQFQWIILWTGEWCICAWKRTWPKFDYSHRLEQTFLPFEWNSISFDCSICSSCMSQEKLKKQKRPAKSLRSCWPKLDETKTRRNVRKIFKVKWKYQKKLIFPLTRRYIWPFAAIKSVRPIFNKVWFFSSSNAFCVACAEVSR